MACKQDPDLLKLSISVDNFSVSVRNYFLTHAHLDHMKQLKANFGEKRDQAKICCTRITADLAKITVDGLKEKDFHIITYKDPVHLSSEVTVYAFPSYHCDGSAMFLFEISGSLRILYTGDFRFRESMRFNDVFGDFMIDRLYIDDTFNEIDKPYPSYEESVKEILAILLKHKRINIHCSILGLEPLLRDVAQTLNIQFGLLPGLRDTWRGQQLEYLLEEHLNPNQIMSVNLGNHKHETDEKIPWIIPSCTWFLCSSKHQEKKPKNHFYVFFCTHSNQIENSKMKVLIGAKEVHHCDVAIQPKELKCAKQ